MKNQDIPNVQYETDFSSYENIFNVYTDSDGKYFYNILKTINFPTDLDPDTFDYYVVKRQDIWPIIAYKFYKNVSLWWVICAVNGVQDPTAFPAIGTVLKILKPEYVRDVLTRINEPNE